MPSLRSLQIGYDLKGLRPDAKDRTPGWLAHSATWIWKGSIDPGGGPGSYGKYDIRISVLNDRVNCRRLLLWGCLMFPFCGRNVHLTTPCDFFLHSAFHTIFRILVLTFAQLATGRRRTHVHFQIDSGRFRRTSGGQDPHYRRQVLGCRLQARHLP